VGGGGQPGQVQSQTGQPGSARYGGTPSAGSGGYFSRPAAAAAAGYLAAQQQQQQQLQQAGSGGYGAGSSSSRGRRAYNYSLQGPAGGL
jgi:hypothetical protein